MNRSQIVAKKAELFGLLAEELAENIAAREFTRSQLGTYPTYSSADMSGRGKYQILEDIKRARRTLNELRQLIEKEW